MIKIETLQFHPSMQLELSAIYSDADRVVPNKNIRIDTH
jgi:hypothetical protein